MHLTPLLSAGIGDILGMLLPCIVVVIYVVGQIMSRGKKAAGKQPVGPRPAGDVEGQGGLVGEIEEFLRRAAGKGQGAAEADVEIIEPEIMAGRPGHRHLAEQPVDAVLMHELAERHNVSAHVQQHMDTSGFEQRSDLLGDRVEQADEEMQEHLDEKFDHTLGSLVDTSVASVKEAKRAKLPEPVHELGEAKTPESLAEQVAATPTAATDFAAMLRNAGNLRQAIVLNEILKRPEERWG